MRKSIGGLTFEIVPSLTAAATRVTGTKIERKIAAPEAWQTDAWKMYDLVGEQRFLCDTLANRLSQARLYVGIQEGGMADDAVPVTNKQVEGILDSIGDGQGGRSQLLHRIGVNLLIAGECWLVGIPSELLDTPSTRSKLEQVPLDSLTWHVLSVAEVSSLGGEVTFTLDADMNIQCEPNDVFLIRIWRPHPRKHWEANSPTRACLPVLHELVGLTMHISAQIDSRLAGAGMLLVPHSASEAVKNSANVTDDSDPLADALIDAMVTPISDRDDASAVVPLVITVPDEAAGKFKHMSFSGGLDSSAKSLRDESIRRLALGQDTPPELLLGMSGMNHWGAWLTREDVVTTHIEPPLALICEALTSQFLRPVLESMGIPEEVARLYAVKYDVEHLVARPNKSQEALSLHSAGVLSDEALRRASGFDETDARTQGAHERAVSMAMHVIAQTPSILQQKTLHDLVTMIETELTAAPTAISGVGTSPEPPQGA